MFNWKKFGVIASLSLSLVIAGCGQEGSDDAANVSEEMGYEITGIEPGAGQTQTNELALAEYESLAGWEQETSSSAAMLTALGDAIANEEPIIVAAWSPHYMFAQYDIKYLDDPKLIFGEEEHITTIVRDGFKEDMPDAYTILDEYSRHLIF